MNRSQRRAAAAKARRTLENKSRPRNIVGTSCHWHGGQPDALVFVVWFTAEQGAGWARNQQDALLRLDASDMTPEVANERLSWLRAHRDWTAGTPVDADAGWWAFTLVNWLESRGHLAGDERNGVSWMVERDGIIASIRSDEISPEMFEFRTIAFDTIGLDANRFVDLTPSSDPDLVADLLGEVRQ